MEEETVSKAVAEVAEKIKAPNIVVIGRTGTGKSSLINAVFGADFAEVGAGFPVTRSFDLYSNALVNVYDSAGYEVSRESDFISNLREFLNAKEIAGIDEKIHLVWYVINSASARVEHFDIEIISQLCKRSIPLIIILSQVDRARFEETEAIRSVLAQNEVTRIFDVLEVSASPLVIRGKPICEPFGLEELVAKTLEKLPEVYADAVRMAQIVDLKPKRELAWKFIVAAAAAAFGSAFIPGLGSTAGAMLALQASLLSKIASIYGFGNVRKLLSDAYGAIFTTPTVGVATIAYGSDFLKSVIPGFGSVVSGATSVSFIAITGLSFASTFEAIAKAHIDPENSEEIKSFFRQSFKEELKKYSGLTIRTRKDLESVKDKFLDQ